MPADLGLSDDGHAIVHAERAGAPGGEVRGEVGMQRPPAWTWPSGGSHRADPGGLSGSPAAASARGARIGVKSAALPAGSWPADSPRTRQLTLDSRPPQPGRT